MNRPVTIVQIAKECGVSIATVSRVMNGTAPVAEATRERVTEAIKRHHYTPNAFARSLIKRQSMTIGVIMPDITNPYFSAMFSELEHAAHEANYSVLLCNTAFSAGDSTRKAPRELDYFQMMLDKNVDGVVVAGGQADLITVTDAYRSALHHLASQLPVVVLGNPIDNVDCLFIQREKGQGVFSAVNYLASLGHRHIAFVGGEQGVGITEARLHAFLDALDTLNLPRHRDTIVLSDYYAPDGYLATKTLLSGDVPFTAMLAMNDNVALGAYRALADAGLRVPQDVSVISCDQFYSADYLIPRLTSVDQHNELFGRFIINSLLGMIQGVKEDVDLTYKPELIIRDSCASPAPASRWRRE